MIKGNNEFVISVDDVGRIVIPKVFRKCLGIDKNGIVTMLIKDKCILITNNRTNNCLDYIKNVFIKTWLQFYPAHTLIIVSNDLVKTADGLEKRKYNNKVIDIELFDIIKDPNFSYKVMKHKKITKDDSLLNYKVLNLYLDKGTIGSLIIIDDDDLSLNSLKIIYQMLNQFLLCMEDRI